MPKKKAASGGGPVFSCDRRELADAIKFAARALPGRPAVPALAGMRIEGDADGTITVAAYDYETSHAARLVGIVQTPGVCLVPGMLFRDLVSAAAGEHAEVDATDGQAVALRSGRARMTLPMIPVEDYPTLPPVPPTVGEIHADQLRLILDATTWAVSRSDVESLSALRGVRLAADGDTITAQATDRFVMMTAVGSWVGKQDLAATVPGRELESAAAGLEGPVEIGADDGRVSLTTARRAVTLRLIDGDYPDVSRLTPDDDAMVAWADVAVADLAGAVKRVGYAAERNTSIVVTATPAADSDDGCLSLHGGSTVDPTAATDDLDAHVHPGASAASGDSGPWSAAFGPGPLGQAAAAVGSPRARLGISAGPMKPCLFLPVHDVDTDVEITAVVMPRRLNPGEQR